MESTWSRDKKGGDGMRISERGDGKERNTEKEKAKTEKESEQ